MEEITFKEYLIQTWLLISGTTFFVIGAWNGWVTNYPRACFFLLLAVIADLNYLQRLSNR